MRKIIYRIVIYVLVLAVIAAITFAPNAGKTDPDIAYWIVGGILFGLLVVFILINEIVIKKSHQK